MLASRFRETSTPLNKLALFQVVGLMLVCRARAGAVSEGRSVLPRGLHPWGRIRGRIQKCELWWFAPRLPSDIQPPRITSLEFYEAKWAFEP